MRLSSAVIHYLLILRSLFLTCGTIVSHSGITSEGEGAFKYFYDDSIQSPCDNIVFLGVGTAMGVEDYDQLSTLIVDGEPTVVIVMDHNPKWFVKLSSQKFARLYNRMLSSLHQIVPVCTQQVAESHTRNNLVFLGAHSASGQASLEALPYLSQKPDGYIGLDPYKIDCSTMHMDASIPTLEWGFQKTTCAVNIDQAAKALYEISDWKHRIFYRVNNTEHSQNRGVAHCVFTDRGCGIICGSKGKGTWIPLAVARSIHSFIHVIQTGGEFHKDAFMLPEVTEGSLDLFLNQESPESTLEFGKSRFFMDGHELYNS